MSKYRRRRRRDSLGEYLRERAEELQLAVPDTKYAPRIQPRRWTITTSGDPAETAALATWRAENGLPP